ncbi:MAG: ribosome recycling factor [Lachnospiraceae bacterium]|nr:ribosome recycling factor [Lachnospiraceae bacterium]
MENDIIAATRERMNKTIAALNTELGGIRAGRANPQLLERLTVEYYGSSMPINQLANLSTPEARMLIIAPWDSKSITAIEKAIQKSDLGINPTNDGKVIRLVFPALTEERRKELVKLVRKYGEESKVAIRNVRRDAIDEIKKQKKNSDITEDDQKILEDKAQKLTDELIKEIDKIISDKEKEILTV